MNTTGQIDTECITPDEPEPSQGGGGSDCSIQYAYKPDVQLAFQNTPNLVFKINYHFVRPTDGSGMHAGDLSALVSDEVIGLNTFYSAMEQPVVPITPPAEYIPDGRVRFELTGIYYHDDDNYYNIPTVHCGSTLRDAFGVDVDYVINIFYYTSSYAGSYGCGPPSLMIVNMTNRMPAAWNDLLAHELGHVIGLSHTFICGSGTVCNDDSYSDTYTPDCNMRQPGCGPTVEWLNTSSACPNLIGTGISNNIMGYNNCRRYLSPMQLARTQYANITNANKRKYILCEPHPYNPVITVSNNVVWNTSKVINANIEVEPNAVLDVRCTLYMSPHAKVIVKPGGKLIVDGGTMTAHSGGCNTFWGGIEVWGTSSQHQYPADNPTFQGIMVLKNGATIEHAREAIRLWKPNDWNSMGGVVQVQGSRGNPGAFFTNCRRSLEFMAYQNFYPSNPAILQTNRSYLKYATFEVNDDYRGGDDFEAHATLWGVDGLQFRACTMKNIQSGIGESPKLGEGILSLDASYTVSGNCTVTLPYGVPCPDDDLDRGIFEGMGHGVDARDGGTGRGFTASNLQFDNNIVGVYANGLPGFTVVWNNFVIGDRDVPLTGADDGMFYQPFHRGISTNRSHGFRIEENNLGPTGTITAAGVDGIVIANSGENNTQVYKNDATGLDHGYIGEGRCIDGTQASSVGHQFICNTNTGNQRDISIRPQADGGWDESIRTQQGSDASPARNTFDQEVGTLDASDIENTSAWVINYWYKDLPYEQPLDVTAGWVGVTEATGTNSCLSRLNGHHVRLTPVLVSQVEANFTASKTAYINSAYVFNALLDGGNTDVVVQEVEDSWPEDAWDLRNYLMSKSPYLSTDVLREMIKKHTMPQAMELEICLANPEATKKEGFTKWAEFDAEHPLPHYMIELIAGSWEAKTFRMQLEAQMGAHHADMTYAADELQAHFRSDSVNVPVDSMLYRWQQLPNFGARYAEAEVHLRKRDFAGARAVMNGLASSYSMKYGRDDERDRMLWLIERFEWLHNDGRTVMQFTTAEVAEMVTFATEKYDRPANWVRNILCFGYKVCLPEQSVHEAHNKALRPVKIAPEVADLPLLKILPNPATAYTTFAHDLKDAVDHAYARVVDARGREVAKLPIQNSPGQLLFDTRVVGSGVYSVELFNNQTRITTERLVIQQP